MTEAFWRVRLIRSHSGATPDLLIRISRKGDQFPVVVDQTQRRPPMRIAERIGPGARDSEFAKSRQLAHAPRGGSSVARLDDEIDVGGSDAFTVRVDREVPGAFGVCSVAAALDALDRPWLDGRETGGCDGGGSKRKKRDEFHVGGYVECLILLCCVLEVLLRYCSGGDRQHLERARLFIC